MNYCELENKKTANMVLIHVPAEIVTNNFELKLIHHEPKLLFKQIIYNI